MMSTSPLRIATRRSDLALWQAHNIADQLRRLEQSPAVDVVHIVTSGDRDQTTALREFGGTGAFTREVQRAVLDGRADLAVHSLKDLPTRPTPGLVLAAVPQRASVHDALVLPASAEPITGLDDLSPEARIGTGSPRRAAQIRFHRPDLEVAGIRGNVPTRLKKLDEGQFDALVLAEAGLRRLDRAARITCLLTPPLFFGAVGQGALGIECRADDQATCELLSRLTCKETWQEVTAERSLLATLRAGCHAPVGVAVARVEVEPEQLRLTAVLLTPDGQTRLEGEGVRVAAEAEELGRDVAMQLIEAGGNAILEGSADST